MKTNWQTKKIGQVCKFQNGFAFKSSLFSDDGFPILRISNIQDNRISYNKLVFFNKEKYKENLDKFIVRKGDLVIAMSGATTGKLAVVDKDDVLYMNQRVGKFEPEGCLLKEYLYYFLSTRIEENLKMSLGAAQPNLSTEQIKDISIPLPTILEQKRIVEILSQAFEKIGKTKEKIEENLKNSKELFESYLNNIFTNPGKNYEEKEIKELFIIQPPKREAKEKLIDSDFVSFVPMEDLGIGTKYFVLQKERKLKEVSNSYTYFANDDVLLAKITPCFENGKIGIARNLKNGIGFGSSEYIVFRSKGSVLPDYLFYYLNREKIRNEGARKMSGAVGHKRVPKEFIENYTLRFPKLIQEQKQIVKKLDQLSEKTQKLESLYKQKLESIEGLKKSILSKAFSKGL